MARLFRFTVECGLVREGGAVKGYGSGLVSSHADAAHALGPGVERRPFALDAVGAQPFATDRMPDVLFVGGLRNAGRVGRAARLGARADGRRGR